MRGKEIDKEMNDFEIGTGNLKNNRNLAGGNDVQENKITVVIHYSFGVDLRGMTFLGCFWGW